MLHALIAVAAAAPLEVRTTVSNTAWCFGSGLRVLYEQDPARPEIVVNTVIDAGAAADPAGQEGLAHLVEHLWFESRPEGGAQVGSRLPALGARHNAWTTHDSTVFWTRAPQAAAKTLLELEAARLENALAGLDAKAVDVERNVVLNELRQRFGSTEHPFRPLLDSLFPAGHPARALPGGTEASVGSLDLAKAKAFTAQWYVPRHATLSVSGPMDGDAFAELLGQTFSAALLVDAKGDPNGSCADRPAPPPLELRDPPDAPVVWDADVDEPYALVGWALPPGQTMLASFDLYLVGILMGNRLERPVSCSVDSYTGADVGTCAFALRDGEDAAKLTKQGITAANVIWEANERQTLANSYGRWQESTRKALFERLERAGGVTAARHFHETGDQDWMTALERQIVVEDFSVAASFGQKHLSAKRAHVVHVRPTNVDPDALPAFHGDRATRSAAAVDPTLVNAAFLARVIGEPDWTRTRTYPLKSGATLTVFPYGKLSINRMSLVYPGGVRTEPRPYLDWLSWWSMPGVDAEGYALARGVLGRWSEVRRSDSWMYTLSGADMDMQLKGLLRHLDTQIPSGESARLIRRNVDELEYTLWGNAEKAMDERLLPGVPRSLPEMQAAVAAFTPKDLKAYAKEKLRPDGAHIVVVGPVDPDQAAGVVRARTAAHKPTGLSRAPPRPDIQAVAPEPAVLAFDDPQARPQAQVILACRVSGGWAAVDVASSVAETKAHDLLRRTAGLTYGVHAWVSDDDAGSRLYLSTLVQADAIGRGVSQLRDTVRGLAKDGPDAREVAAAKVKSAIDLADLLQHPDQILYWVQSRALQGTPNDRRLADDLAAVDAAAVKAALAPCAGHEVITVVGTGATDALKAAGIEVTAP